MNPYLPRAILSNRSPYAVGGFNQHRAMLRSLLAFTWISLVFVPNDVLADGPQGQPHDRVQGNPTSLPSGTYAGSCRAWDQVNNAAFDLNLAPYTNEEGFEVLVYDQQLYVGMEADNTLGARVWRTLSSVVGASGQSDWEQVVDDAFGEPTAENDHIDSLAEFNVGGTDYIYASTATRGVNAGTRVYRSSSGDLGTWSLAQTNGAGFGDVNNENFKDMISFDAPVAGGGTQLCTGTGNNMDLAEFWCTDDTTGTTWTKRNTDGFGGSTNALQVRSTAIFGGDLYASTAGDSDIGAIWETDGTLSGGGPDWNWTQVYTPPGGSGIYIDGLIEYDGNLYAAYNDSSNEIVIVNSSDGSTWSQASRAGMDGDALNQRPVSDSQVVYNGALYYAVLRSSTASRTEIWRTNGQADPAPPPGIPDLLQWEQVSTADFDSSAFAAQLAVLNGHLYAWSSDWTNGQKVWRSKCPICQDQTVSGTGLVSFSGVDSADVEMNFTSFSGSADTVTLCTFPDAFPNLSSSMKPVKRHFEISVGSSITAYSADLTLSYHSTDGEEFTPSDISSESTTRLTRWDTASTAWEDCASVTSRDTAANTTSCSSVSELEGIWTVTGDGAGPTAARIQRFEGKGRQYHLGEVWIQRLLSWFR